MGDRGRQLPHRGDAIGVGELRLRGAQGLFGSLAFGDVAPDAAVADEAPRLIEHRQPRDGHIALAAVAGRSSELKITERQMGIERLPVLAPGLCVRLQVRHFPARLTDLGARRRRVGKALREFLVGKAMLRVGLPVHVEGELHEGAKAFLTLPQRLFHPLALGQIKDEANALICILFEHRPADQHGHAASVFTQILLLEWRERPDQLQLRDVACVEVAPFRRRQHRTLQASRGEILAVVPHDAQKRVIGLKYATFEVPDHDPDDIGIDEASDLPVALPEIAVELNILLGRLSPSLRLAPRECQCRAR